MKVCFIGLFGIILTFGSTMGLSAEDNNLAINQNSYFFTTAFMNQDFNFFASEGEASNQSLSNGRRVGLGFMNLFLGLGQFTIGDWGGGLFLIGFEALSTLCIYHLASGSYKSILWTPVEFFTGAFWLLCFVVVAGEVAIPILTLWGCFSSPFQPMTGKYKYRSTARLDDLRNWNIGLVSDEKGRLAGQIAFTAHL
jgi:hypothetical protein